MSFFSHKVSAPDIFPFQLPKPTNEHELLLHIIHKTSLPFLNLLSEEKSIFFRKAVLLECYCYFFAFIEDYSNVNLIPIYSNYIAKHLDFVIKERVLLGFKSVNEFLIDRMQLYQFEMFSWGAKSYTFIRLRHQILSSPTYSEVFVKEDIHRERLGKEQPQIDDDCFERINKIAIELLMRDLSKLNINKY